MVFIILLMCDERRSNKGNLLYSTKRVVDYKIRRYLLTRYPNINLLEIFYCEKFRRRVLQYVHRKNVLDVFLYLEVIFNDLWFTLNFAIIFTFVFKLLLYKSTIKDNWPVNKEIKDCLRQKDSDPSYKLYKWFSVWL